MAFVNLSQAVFPVGTIYLSSTSLSPASTIGGTWSRVQGANLWAADEQVRAGSFGGSKTITVSQMPVHTHSQDVYTNESGSVTVPAWYLWLDRWNTGGAVRSNGETPKTGCSRGRTGFGATSSSGQGATFIPYSYGVYVWVRTA